MAVNMALARQRGISQESIEKINELHEDLEYLIRSYKLSDYLGYSELRQHIHELEFMLQGLWEFPLDARYHTWVSRLAQKHMQLEWEGRTFRCVKTNQQATIERGDVYECGTWCVGECMIDFGRAGAYSRIVGELEEIK